MESINVQHLRMGEDFLQSLRGETPTGVVSVAMAMDWLIHDNIFWPNHDSRISYMFKLIPLIIYLDYRVGCFKICISYNE